MSVVDSRYPALAGRIFYALIFIVSGMDHFLDLDGMALMAADKGVPVARLAVGMAGFLFLAGGLLVLFGWRTRLGAAILVLTLLPVTFAMHRPLDDPGQIVQVLKNLALVGGGLLLMAHGPGALSLDGTALPADPEDVSS
ncbi:MAG: DoxX family protein [Acidobacteriota bacterium]